MATIRLIPSIFYNAAGTSYLTVANQNNALTNTDSTTYATVSNINASTTSRYIYLQGFNFSDVPSNAVINSFSIKLKGNESGGSTSTSYRPVLCKGTSTYSNAYCDPLTTTVATHEFTFTQDYATFADDGDDFGIRINCRRGSRNTAATHHIYGAEIEVNYTIPTPHTITTELTGNGTIVPSGSNTYSEGNEFNLTITPTDTTETVTASKNGADITEDLVVHYKTGPSTTDNRVLGTYSLVSGGFNGSGASYFQGIVGKGHTGSTTTSNYYSSSSSTTAVFTYDMSFTLPDGAVVTDLYVMVNGHAESTSQSSEYMCAQLISGSTHLSEELNFKNIGTSNSTQTIRATTMPTVEQVANLKLQCRLGYYGGAINGATCYIEYAIPTTEIDYYTYSYTVDGDATIAVTIGAPGPSTATIYYKNNNSWVAATAVYKKVNGSWVLQSNLSNVFDINTKYACGDAPLEPFLTFSQGQTASSVNGSTCRFLSSTISHAAYVPVRLVGSIHAKHGTKEADYPFDVIINLTNKCPCINITPWPNTLVESIYISPSISSDIVTQIYFTMPFSVSATSSAPNTIELTSNCNFYDLGNFETIYTYNYNDGGTPPAISLSSANLQNGDVCVLNLLSSNNSSGYPGHSYVDSLYKEFIWDGASHTFVGDNERISTNVTASSITFSGFDSYQSIFFGRKL